MKPKWLNRDVPTAPYYTLCLTEKDFHRELKRLKLKASTWPDFVRPGSHARCNFLENSDGSCAAIVTADRATMLARDPVEAYGLLIHEAVHVWQEFREIIGERNPGSEQEAYAIQVIGQSLIAEFLRQTKKRGKK